MLDGAIQPVMFSAVSRVQADLDQVKGLTKRALKTSSFLVIPVMGLFALVADPFYAGVFRRTMVRGDSVSANVLFCICSVPYPDIKPAGN